jgi:hypothetical protein
MKLNVAEHSSGIGHWIGLNNTSILAKKSRPSDYNRLSPTITMWRRGLGWKECGSLLTTPKNKGRWRFCSRRWSLHLRYNHPPLFESSVKRPFFSIPICSGLKRLPFLTVLFYYSWCPRLDSVSSFPPLDLRDYYSHNSMSHQWQLILGSLNTSGP